MLICDTPRGIDDGICTEDTPRVGDDTVDTLASGIEYAIADGKVALPRRVAMRRTRELDMVVVDVGIRKEGRRSLRDGQTETPLI